MSFTTSQKNIINENSISVQSKINYEVNNDINLKIAQTTSLEYREKLDKEVQTDHCHLYYEEKEIDIDNNNIFLKNKRKISPDLIRDKIFNHFNKVLYIWLTANIKDDKPEVIQFTFQQNNKTKISETMEKQLKEIFFDPEEINRLNITDNEFLKEILELKYEDIYNIFIGQPKNSEEKNNTKFLNHFSYLSDFLKEMEGKECQEYITRVREVATRYKEWIKNKIHLFKNSKK